MNIPPRIMHFASTVKDSLASHQHARRTQSVCADAAMARASLHVGWGLFGLILARKPSNGALDNGAERVISRVELGVVKLSHIVSLRKVEHATFPIRVTETMNRSLVCSICVHIRTAVATCVSCGRQLWPRSDSLQRLTV